MTSLPSAFLTAIQADDASDAILARLAYADWLEEHSQEWDALYHRAQAWRLERTVCRFRVTPIYWDWSDCSGACNWLHWDLTGHLGLGNVAGDLLRAINNHYFWLPGQREAPGRWILTVRFIDRGVTSSTTHESVTPPPAVAQIAREFYARLLSHTGKRSPRVRFKTPPAGYVSTLPV